MGCTVQDIILYLKDTTMLIGYLMLNTQNLIVVMCLHWEEQQSHGNKWLLPDSQWKFIALDKCGE